MFLSLHSFADTFISKIQSIDKGKRGEDHLVLLSTGEVAFMESRQKTLLAELERSHKNHDTLEVVLSKNHKLISFEIVLPDDRNESLETRFDTDEDEVPSIVTLKGAQTIFKRMSKRYQNKSQCFNRAHIWVYDEFMKSGTKLNKVFLFFTSRYIRKYRYHWWFHVTPMAYVGGSRFANWRMLDRRYTKGPLQSKTWTNIFIKSKRTCKVVTTFSQYFNNQEGQDCYMIRSSQYYLVPSDLDMLEVQGKEKTSFDPIEVEHARWEAF